MLLNTYNTLMKNPRFLAPVLAAFLFVPSVHAFSDAQLDSIRELGRLNGIALHCRYIEETRRMKRGLVLHLPKRRQLGELFDHESNASFMAFIENKGGCPAAAEFAVEVRAAVEVLEKEYANY